MTILTPRWLPFVLLACGAMAVPPAPLGAQHERAVWLWERDAYEILDDEEARLAALDFLEAEGFTVVYLYADAYRGRNVLRDEPWKYRALLPALRARGIEPFALLGSAFLDTPTYVFEEKRDEAEAMLRRVLDYNARSAPRERFLGVNIDLEPHLLPDWERNRQTRAVQYLELSRRFMEMKAESGQELAVGSSTPFWFDTVRDVVFEGVGKPLSEHVQDVHDYVTLMAYRDFSEGPDGILFHAAAEMDYADAVGKTLVVGVETVSMSPGLDKVTFFEEGRGALEAELRAVIAAWGERPGFGGVAVHHFRSLRRLAEGR